MRDTHPQHSCLHPCEPQADIELELVVVRLHVRAQGAERLVMPALPGVRQFMNNDHILELGRRLAEEAGDTDLSLSFEM